MKYMLTWDERDQGSTRAYEDVQKRILGVFTQWQNPDALKIEMFVVRLGDWGGDMLLDCDDPLAIHKFCSTEFAMQVRLVAPVMDAARVEQKAIAWRDGLRAR